MPEDVPSYDRPSQEFVRAPWILTDSALEQADISGVTDSDRRLLHASPPYASEVPSYGPLALHPARLHTRSAVRLAGHISLSLSLTHTHIHVTWFCRIFLFALKLVF